MRDIRALIEDCELFEDWPESLIHSIMAKAVSRTFNDGEVIYSRGDEGDGFYGILTGAVVHSMTGVEGKEVLLAVMRPGVWFGEISMLDGKERPTSAEARGETRVLFLRREEFLRILDANPALYQSAVKFVCNHVRLSFGWIDDMIFLSLEERLAKRLLLLAERGKSDAADGHDIRVTQEELASSLGATRESIGRQLADWREKGWIKPGYRHIVIHDLKALRSVVGQAIGMPFSG